jgi:hypothetical protein
MGRPRRWQRAQRDHKLWPSASFLCVSVSLWWNSIFRLLDEFYQDAFRGMDKDVAVGSGFDLCSDG